MHLATLYVLTIRLLVLMFFQMTKVTDIMENFMKWMGYESLTLDYGTKTDEPPGPCQAVESSQFAAQGVHPIDQGPEPMALVLRMADAVIV
jgi:ATP-dependent helicase STH1/SNF2